MVYDKELKVATHLASKDWPIGQVYMLKTGRTPVLTRSTHVQHGLTLDLPCKQPPPGFRLSVRSL